MFRRVRCSVTRAFVTFAAIVVAGCVSVPDQGMPVGVPAPPVRLIAAGDLKLPGGCEFLDGVLYRSEFVVQGDGRVVDIRPGPAPACLQAALADWLGSFQYAPPGEAVATTFDWMAVTARRSD